MTITETGETQDLSGPEHFEATLYPNQSLGDTGFALLMGGIVLVSGLVGAGFALAGAWPVTGFLGLDVLLLYLAFRWQFRQSRRADMIRIDETGVTVQRIAPQRQAQSWHFDTAWVQVVQEDRALKLRSHGKDLVIGSFLTADERRTLARALRSAIQNQRDRPKAGAPG